MDLKDLFYIACVFGYFIYVSCINIALLLTVRRSCLGGRVRIISGPYTCNASTLLLRHSSRHRQGADDIPSFMPLAAQPSQTLTHVWTTDFTTSPPKIVALLDQTSC